MNGMHGSKRTTSSVASAALCKVNVTKDHTHWTYEPHVAAKITREMLDEAGVKVLTKRVLKSVTKDGTRIANS
jgi:hypothetical protein